MSYIFRTLLLLFLSINLFPSTPNKIILLIGDGMGTSHFTYLKIINSSTVLNQFKTAALVSNFSYNNYYTDSAASATAMATGIKTLNGNIGVDHKFKKLKSITEYAKEKGLSTGIVCTSSVTHATPAAFFAHEDSRKSFYKIAEDLVESNIDVLFGGGKKYFNISNTNKLIISGKPLKIIDTKNDFFNISADFSKAWALLAPDHLPKAELRTPSLKEMTLKAIDILNCNEKGFFLLVEGSQIDWMAHDNNNIDMHEEIICFSNTIDAVFNKTKELKDLLMIVTSDHETGGYAINKMHKKNIKDSFSSRNHTIELIPLFAYGSGAEKFSGLIDNTDIGKKLIEFIQEI